MPSSIRWRCLSGGRPLRLNRSCSFAPGAARAPSSSSCPLHPSHSRCLHARSSNSSRCVSTTASRPCRPPCHSQHSSPQNHFSQTLRPPQPHHTSQRRVYQTSIPLPATATATATNLPLTLSGCRSLLALSDLPTPSSLPFSTSSRRPPSSSSSHPLASVAAPFSRKQRRRLARWLPALMASQARSHSDDAHTHDDDAAKAGGHAHAHAHGVLGHHHHHHDNVYLTSGNKNDAGVRITRIGLYSNLGMAFAKGAGGYFFNSQAMVADAWHSLTDLASDVLTLATVSWSLRPPTSKFPSGFGKVESLGSLGVSGMLLGGGIFMCISSLQSLHAHFFLDAAAAAEALAHGHGHGHGHSHSHAHTGGPSLHAAWLALGTVLVKEWLYRATMKVARERKSSVLASNAVHHRVDSLTGCVTLLVILGANLLHDASWLDPVGGLFISLLVIRAGLENTVSAVYELADRSIDDDVKRSVRKHVAQALAQDIPSVHGQQHVAELRDVSGVKSGQNYLVDLELAVPGDWTVENVRAVEDAVRTQVGASVRGVRRVRVRFVKLDETVERFDDFIPGTVSQRSSPEPEPDHGHEHGGKEHKH